jgi:hypothetical protein
MIDQKKKVRLPWLSLSNVQHDAHFFASIHMYIYIYISIFWNIYFSPAPSSLPLNCLFKSGNVMNTFQHYRLVEGLNIQNFLEEPFLWTP